MVGTFATWQPEYAARGLATFPLRSDDRKRPAVGNYGKMGLRASHQLVMKWGDAEGLACMAGSRNKITVVDVDARGSEGERLAADIQTEIGRARFIVRTGGGGFHLYYKHAGEGRKVRFDPRKPIDLLGGGQIVLPPSRGAKSPYEIVEGSLDDLASLAPIQRVPAPQPSRISPVGTENFGSMRAHSGRNEALFDTLCREARNLPATLEAFVNRGRELNRMFGEPMGDAQVVDTAKSVFGYLDRGELRTGAHGAWFRKAQVTALARDPYLFALIGWLKAQNGPDAEFWIANGLASAHLGWPLKQLRETRRRAQELGWIEMIAAPMRGRNALYRWGAAARTTQI